MQKKCDLYFEKSSPWIRLTWTQPLHVFAPPLSAVLRLHDGGTAALLCRGLSILLQVSEGEGASPLAVSGSGSDRCSHGAGLHHRQQISFRAPPPDQLAQSAGLLHTGLHTTSGGFWHLCDLPQGAAPLLAPLKTQAVPRHLWVAGLPAGHRHSGVRPFLWLVPGQREGTCLVGLTAAALLPCFGSDEPDHKRLPAPQEDEHLEGSRLWWGGGSALNSQCPFLTAPQIWMYYCFFSGSDL